MNKQTGLKNKSKRNMYNTGASSHSEDAGSCEIRGLFKVESSASPQRGVWVWQTPMPKHLGIGETDKNNTKQTNNKKGKKTTTKKTLKLLNPKTWLSL